MESSLQCPSAGADPECEIVQVGARVVAEQTGEHAGDMIGGNAQLEGHHRDGVKLVEEHASEPIIGCGTGIERAPLHDAQDQFPQERTDLDDPERAGCARRRLATYRVRSCTLPRAVRRWITLAGIHTARAGGTIHPPA